MQWIYGLFLDMMSYCANALLGVMSTDLEFFETSVPVVRTLYAVLVAIGWGLLIGNCAFQCMKAMFAGFGFETESPVILLLRTFLFGFLLIFSGDICEIGLSIGKRVIDLLGVPTSISLTLPNESMFGGIGASWLLVIIVGFVLGFQLIKLFFEIAEGYVLVAVLTLLCPIGLAFGGSKSTKDICTGFIRTYASMIVMMVMNVLFLKLILSALSSMPTGAMVLPWCLLVVGIAKTARKADQLVSRIGLNPAMTGDPLGVGKGMMVMAVAARTIIGAAGKIGRAAGNSGKAASGTSNSASSGRLPAPANHSSRNYGGSNASNVRNSTGGTTVGGSNTGGNTVSAGTTLIAASDSSSNTQRNGYNSNMAGSRNATNNRSASTVRFGANTYSGGSQSASSSSGRNQFASSGGAQVNTNRFGSQPGMGKPSTGNGTGSYTAGNSGNSNPAVGKGKSPNSVAGSQSGGAKVQSGKNVNTTTAAGMTTAKTGGKGSQGGANVTASRKAPKGAAQKQTQRNAAQTATTKAKKNRFGAGQNPGTVRQNANPVGAGAKTAMPKTGMVRTNPGSTKASAKPDVVEKTDTVKEVAQDIDQPTAAKDGENSG